MKDSNPTIRTEQKPLLKPKFESNSGVKPDLGFSKPDSRSGGKPLLGLPKGQSSTAIIKPDDGIEVDDFDNKTNKLGTSKADTNSKLGGSKPAFNMKKVSPVEKTVQENNFDFDDDLLDKKPPKPQNDAPPKNEKKSDWSFDEEEIKDETKTKKGQVSKPVQNQKQRPSSEDVPFEEEIIEDLDDKPNGNIKKNRRTSNDYNDDFGGEIIDDEVDQIPTKRQNTYQNKQPLNKRELSYERNDSGTKKNQKQRPPTHELPRHPPLPPKQRTMSKEQSRPYNSQLPQHSPPSPSPVSLLMDKHRGHPTVASLLEENNALHNQLKYFNQKLTRMIEQRNLEEKSEKVRGRRGESREHKVSGLRKEIENNEKHLKIQHDDFRRLEAKRERMTHPSFLAEVNREILELTTQMSDLKKEIHAIEVENRKETRGVRDKYTKKKDGSLSSHIAALLKEIDLVSRRNKELAEGIEDGNVNLREQERFLAEEVETRETKIKEKMGRVGMVEETELIREYRGVLKSIAEHKEDEAKIEKKYERELKAQQKELEEMTLGHEMFQKQFDEVLLAIEKQTEELLEMIEIAKVNQTPNGVKILERIKEGVLPGSVVQHEESQMKSREDGGMGMGNRYARLENPREGGVQGETRYSGNTESKVVAAGSERTPKDPFRPRNERLPDRSDQSKRPVVETGEGDGFFLTDVHEEGEGRRSAERERRQDHLQQQKQRQTEHERSKSPSPHHKHEERAESTGRREGSASQVKPKTGVEEKKTKVDMGEFKGFDDEDVVPAAPTTKKPDMFRKSPAIPTAAPAGERQQSGSAEPRRQQQQSSQEKPAPTVTPSPPPAVAVVQEKSKFDNTDLDLDFFPDDNKKKQSEPGKPVVAAPVVGMQQSQGPKAVVGAKPVVGGPKVIPGGGGPKVIPNQSTAPKPVPQVVVQQTKPKAGDPLDGIIDLDEQQPTTVTAKAPVKVVEPQAKRKDSFDFDGFGGADDNQPKGGSKKPRQGEEDPLAFLSDDPKKAANNTAPKPTSAVAGNAKKPMADDLDDIFAEPPKRQTAGVAAGGKIDLGQPGEKKAAVKVEVG